MNNEHYQYAFEKLRIAAIHLQRQDLRLAIGTIRNLADYLEEKLTQIVENKN